MTLLFSAEQYQASAEAYLRGIERRVQAGLDPAVASVGSVFVRRWDTAVAQHVPAELWDRLGIAEATLAYRAPLTINTMPDATLLAYADHGPLGDPMATDGGDAEHTLADFATAGVDQQALAEQLQREGGESFERSGTACLPALRPNTNS